MDRMLHSINQHPPIKSIGHMLNIMRGPMYVHMTKTKMNSDLNEQSHEVLRGEK